MMFIFRSIACFLVAATIAVAQSQPKFGQRPANSVFDPTGVLNPKQQAEIGGPLQEILENENIDVLVVILPEIGDAPPEHVAGGYAEKWGASKITSVVLHVPGNADSPWIFPGSLLSGAIKRESIQETLDAAEKRAAAEPDDFGKVRAASVEAADAVRYWMGGAVLNTEARINERLRLQLAFEKRDRLLKLSAVLGLAAAVPLVLGVVFLFLRMRRSGPKTFPPVRKIPRLGAPYSGGNNAATPPL